MAYGEFSEEFKKYKKLRDEKLAGLERCNFILMPADLQQKGFKLIDSVYFNENSEEHELHEFRKGQCRIIYLQTYIEREGGMHIQGLFASPNCIDELEELIDN